MDMRDYWTSGQSLDDYVTQLWRKHRTRFTRNRERTTIPAELVHRFGGRHLRLLILTEPYCEDSTQLVPMVWMLAQLVEDIEVRIQRPGAHPALVDHFLTDAGHPAIPVFIVLDEELHELGALVERPKRVTADMAAEMRRFQLEHPELPGITRMLDHMPAETHVLLKQHLNSWREAQHDRWTRYLLEDLLGMIETARPGPMA
jgi:hypothetical protein